MRLTLEQARALNISEDIIRRALAVETPVPIAGVSEPPATATKPRQTKPGRSMTKLEASFADTLSLAQRQEEINRWWREPITLRLAGRTRYTPDFLVEDDNARRIARLTLIEVKGPYARDDSLVKLKVAAEMFPCFGWLFVRRSDRNGWEVREVTNRGIGTSPISVPWINGGIAP